MKRAGEAWNRLLQRPAEASTSGIYPPLLPTEAQQMLPSCPQAESTKGT